jgi:hypothetical protein
MQILDTKWRESKTVKTHAMPRVAEDTFGTDFFWAHGAYAMCDNGLFRTASQVDDGLENVVFPSLHRIRDDGVSDKITKIIRDNLPAIVPEDIRKQHSAKSLRKGAITELSLHKDMNEFSVTACSGHVGDNSMYWYLSYLNARQSLPAAQVLQVSTLICHGSQYF